MGGAIGIGIGIPFSSTIGIGNRNKPVVQVLEWDEVGYQNGSSTIDVEVHGKVVDDLGFQITGNNGTYARFHLGTNPDLSQNPSLDFNYPVFPGVAQQKTFTNLVGGQTYYYGVIADNGEGVATSQAIQFVAPPKEMIVRFDTALQDNSGLSDTEIRLPFAPVTYTENTQFNLDITVDWGDGNQDVYNTNPVNFPADVPLHQYQTPGVYEVTITPNTRGIEGWSYTASTGNAQQMTSWKLTDIIQWGDMLIGCNTNTGGVNAGFQGSRYWYECQNLGPINADDTPLITGNVMRQPQFNWGNRRAISGVGIKDQNISNLNNWDMRTMVRVENLFAGCPTFNSNVEDWYMPLAETLIFIFRDCDAFSGDVSKWNTSSAEQTAGLFENCDSFNSDCSTKQVTRKAVQGRNYPDFVDTAWNVSNVYNFASMFKGCGSFTNGSNPDGLNDWLIRQTAPPSGTVASMANMFNNMNFNGKISDWQVNQFKSFESMFQNNTAFNQDIGLWNFSGMAVGSCNSASIIYFLRGATAFNQDISNWDLTGAGGLNGLMAPNFAPTPTAADPTLSPSIYNDVLVNFAAKGNYSRAANCTFFGNTNYFAFGNSRYDSNDANVVAARNQLITDLGAIIDGGPVVPLTDATIKSAVLSVMNLDPVNASIADPTYGLMRDWDVSQVTDMSKLFSTRQQYTGANLENWDVSNVTNFEEMFKLCSVFDGNLSNWNTSSATTMEDMLYECQEFGTKGYSIDSWDLSNVTLTRRMLEGCRKFNLPVNSWDVSNVTDMQGMFRDCFIFNQPLNNWNVSSVERFNNMFLQAFVFNQPLSNWDVSNAITLGGMFSTSGFNQPIGNWTLRNTGLNNPVQLGSMFQFNTAFNQDISSWNTSSVNNMIRMFEGATAMNQDLSGWSVNGVTFCSKFADGATSWTENKPPFNNCNPN